MLSQGSGKLALGIQGVNIPKEEGPRRAPDICGLFPGATGSQVAAWEGWGAPEKGAAKAGMPSRAFSIPQGCRDKKSSCWAHFSFPKHLHIEFWPWEELQR